MPYEPHLIADMRMGVELGRQPWVSPPAAWREMQNAYVFRGRVWKRNGFGWFGELGTYVAAEALSVGGAGTAAASGTLANTPVCRQKGTAPTQTLGLSYAVKLYDVAGGSAYGAGVNHLYDLGDGIIYDFDGVTARGTINYETGVVSVSGLVPNIGPSGLYASYEHMDSTLGGAGQNSVMGIDSLFPRGGGETLFAWDRENMWKYDATEERFEPFSQGDWSGGLSNFYWTENFFGVNAAADDALLITNGVDPILYTNGSTLLELHTDWAHPLVAPGVGLYSRKIDYALMCFRIKNRCVLLHTGEESFGYPQRARWSIVNPIFTEHLSGQGSWLITDYADAPTADWIVSASFLGDDLVVFFERSMWKLRWRDDFRSPFEWERLFETDGSFATMSTVDFSNEVVTLGSSGLISTDGVDVEAAASQVPDISLDWNPAAFQYSFGIVIEEGRQALFSFTASGLDYPEGAMVLQYEDDAVSFYDFEFHCYGYYQFESTPVWDDYPLDWDEYAFAWDERTFQAGFPAALAGDRNLRIFILWSELTDWSPTETNNESPVEMSIMSNRLNPYMDRGKRCRLGFLNIYASTNADIELEVSIFGDFTGVAYLTKKLTLEGVGSKVKKRIPVFVDRAFHQIQIVERSGKLLRIDGVELETMPVGEMRNL